MRLFKQQYHIILKYTHIKYDLSEAFFFLTGAQLSGTISRNLNGYLNCSAHLDS